MMRSPLLLILLVFIVSGCRQSEKTASPPERPEMERSDKKKEDTEPGMAFLVRSADQETAGSASPFTSYGRTNTDENGVVELIGPASGVRFRAMGDSVSVQLSTPGMEHAYALLTINGEPYKKIRVSGSGSTKIAAELPDSDSWYELGVHKLTEAQSGGLLFLGAGADQLTTTEYSREVQIEFVGNSITCGYGADTRSVPCGTDKFFDQHNAWEAYAVQAARGLKADYVLSAVSGIGVYRNYGSEDAPTMPDLYGNVFLDDGRSSSWEPEGWSPDLISICLGTNDLSMSSANRPRSDFDREKFIAAYINFVHDLKKRYPGAAFGLIASPMVSLEKKKILLDCLYRVQDHFKDTEVIEVFEFKDVYTSGCAGHPDLGEHELMAEQLLPFYSELLVRLKPESYKG